MTDRRSFVAWLGSLPFIGTHRSALPTPPLTLEATPTALYQQPDGRRNLVRITVSGLDAPAGRARLTDRRGALVGSAGLLPAGSRFEGEVWVPLSEPSDFRIDVEVGKQRVARRRVRLVPPRRWTLYWLSTIHTDVGYTDLQERCLEIHRGNLDAALARLPGHPDYRWTAECALQVISYVENRSPEAAAALVEAIRGGKIGFQAVFANLLTGLLDHETLARVAWPAGLLAREHGLGFAAAQLTDVPGQTLTFPTVLAASGVRYLATGPNPERAVPLLSAAEAAAAGLTGDWPAYPQVYWWEGPDGSRVLHWRAHHYGDGTRFGFDVGPEEMGRRLSDWLLTNPVFLSPHYPFDVALLYGASAIDNAVMDEQLVQHMEEFNRRFAFPRIVPSRAEDFFRELERRYGGKLPVRRGDTGCYWEDGAASTAAELAWFRRAQLVARAAELVALWEDRLEGRDAKGAARIARRAAERRAMWRDLLLFGEHTWGADVSVSAPDSRQTVAQWGYKRRFLEGAAAAAERQLAEGLLRIGGATQAGPGRVVFNASSWRRTDIARVEGGAGRRLSYAGTELPAVDLPDGSALVLVRDVPALGYLALTEGERPPRPPADEGAGAALDAQAGGFRVALDPATGAIRSLTGGDGKERVNPGAWSGLNQLVYVRGGERSALWTDGAREYLKTPAGLAVAQAELVAARRERLPGIGARLVATRRLEGFPSVTSTVTLYDDLPWIDVEDRITKTATLEKEALYVAFPFALTKPVVEVEVPLGRMTVERDQQPGSCRDWFCHAHWVWLHDSDAGVLWSGPDSPLFTLNDIVRGAWRRRIEPDGTLFAYAMNNYWHTNYAARQGGEHTLRFRVSLLPAGAEPAEPVRRGWAACDPLYVSGPYTTVVPGPLIAKDAALTIPDAGALVVGAKPADDGEGAIVKLLDVAGAARSVSVWPAAYTFRRARRATLVEMNGDALPVAQDGRVTLELPAWGVDAARLFTPREGAH
jgi:alpha-mannosidase